MSRRAEYRREAKKKPDAVYRVTRAELEKMIADATRKAWREHQMYTAFATMKVYERVQSVVLMEMGWGARGPRMKRYFDRTGEIMDRFGRILDKGKPEEIRAFCDEYGVDPEIFGAAIEAGIQAGKLEDTEEIEIDLIGGEA